MYNKIVVLTIHLYPYFRVGIKASLNKPAAARKAENSHVRNKKRTDFQLQKAL